jgi:hypothetical protein
MSRKRRIAIIGGGVSGVSSALALADLALEVTLFEKRSTLVDGPPWCHLHAGGNLYREISDMACITLLKQSIDFIKRYPFVVDYRPTVIALPIEDVSTPHALLPRLKLLRATYQKMIDSDSSNEVLGGSSDYFRLYSKEQMELLKEVPIPNAYHTFDDWMIPVAHHLDLSKVQFPLVMVQEYGLNLFRLSAGAMLQLDASSNASICYNSQVEAIEKSDQGWRVDFTRGDTKGVEEFDYIINSTGFRTGEIDDMVGVKTNRMVEFKASYVTQWKKATQIVFPEIIIHGERGTPRGMGQFTPYPQGYFQLHGMTKEITLYPNGLVANPSDSSQPSLDDHFLQKIDKGWSREELEERTYRAIDHLSRFIPDFRGAKIGSKPLFGAQQIIGDDPSCRVAEVAFPLDGYARCEVVKVSSTIDMVGAIIRDLVRLDLVDSEALLEKSWCHSLAISHRVIDICAKKIAVERNYPSQLAMLRVKKEVRFSRVESDGYYRRYQA